jgi:hypothetical protein
MVPSVFSYGRCGETCAHDQENKARNLEPELVQDASGSPGGSKGSLLHGLQGLAAPGLLPGNLGHYPQLSCRRNLIHGSILTAFGATMTQTRSVVEPFGCFRHPTDL